MSAERAAEPRPTPPRPAPPRPAPQPSAAHGAPPPDSDRQTCPKFHCDYVVVRLITTYAGPGTEYVRADSAGAIRRAGPGSLVLLKGRRHPTHADTVHHRSPPVAAGARRLVVAMDCEEEPLDWSRWTRTADSEQSAGSAAA